MLQCVAVCCSVLQCGAFKFGFVRRRTYFYPANSAWCDAFSVYQFYLDLSICKGLFYLLFYLLFLCAVLGHTWWSWSSTNFECTLEWHMLCICIYIIDTLTQIDINVCMCICICTYIHIYL